VYAKDVASPYESRTGVRTVRFVRVLDLIVVLGMALRAWEWCGPCTLKVTPGKGRRGVIAGLGCQAVVYLLGGCIDYYQCHVQASGVGSKCHGLWCLDIAAITLGVLTVSYFNQRYFFMACFGVQGVHRLMWASRTDQPMSIRGTVFAMALVLIVLPIIVYFQELAAGLTGSRARQDHLEMGLPQPSPQLPVLDHILDLSPTCVTVPPSQ